jgi:hypothetical protein
MSNTIYFHLSRSILIPFFPSPETGPVGAETPEDEIRKTAKQIRDKRKVMKVRGRTPGRSQAHEIRS